MRIVRRTVSFQHGNLGMIWYNDLGFALLPAHFDVGFHMCPCSKKMRCSAIWLTSKKKACQLHHPMMMTKKSPARSVAVVGKSWVGIYP